MSTTNTTDLTQPARDTIETLGYEIFAWWGEPDTWRIARADEASGTFVIWSDASGWHIEDLWGSQIHAHQIARALDCGAHVYDPKGNITTQAQAYEQAAQAHLSHMEDLDAFEDEHGFEADPDLEVEFCPWCGTSTQHWNEHSCYGTQGEAWEAARSDDR